MSPLTLLLLQIGFLVLLWFFVFAVVYSLRADLFGVKVRKLPEPAAAGAAPAASPAVTAHASSEGASTPLMSFRFSSGISVRSKPPSSAARAISAMWANETGVCSSSTLRSQPPKMGVQ